MSLEAFDEVCKPFDERSEAVSSRRSVSKLILCIGTPFERDVDSAPKVL